MEIGQHEVTVRRFALLRERWGALRGLARRLRGLRRSFAGRRVSAEVPEIQTIAESQERHPADVGPIDALPQVHVSSTGVSIDRAGSVRIPSTHRFRVLFVVRPGLFDAACMRYRAYNLIEALRLAGFEAAHLDDRRIPQRLAYALGFDLIVLVRREMSPEISMLLDAAHRCAVPVLSDLDDYLFHEEAIPFVEMYRTSPLPEARRSIAKWRDVILRCDAFTTTTPLLLGRAAALGQRCHLIRNGLNWAQIELSRIAREESRRAPRKEGIRLGYFSGTRTHQDDFRLIAKVLVRILEEFPAVGLTVAGDFDLDEFNEFARFRGRVESRPFVDWRLLPSEIIRADINLIPLRTNLFTEAKSDLKYYEAGLLRIPSVASPTQPYASSIEHGVNGLLARSSGEWYDAMRSLIINPDLRRKLGDRAYEHVMRTYVPGVVADEALTAYRDVLGRHRRGLGIVDEAPTVTILLTDLARSVRDRSSVVALGVGLGQAGAIVTLLLPEAPDQLTAARAIELVDEHYPASNCAVQVGGEIPCCDLILATDRATARRARQFQHRARKVAYFLSESDPGPVPGAMLMQAAAMRRSSGLALLVADPSVTQLLGESVPEKLWEMPPWVGRAPVPLAPLHASRSILVVAAPGRPSLAPHQAAEALRQVQAAHPDLHIVLCGDLADPGMPGFHRERLAGLWGAGFERVLADRPICLALYGLVRPAWVYDLMAAGCPVISSPCFVEPRHPDTESSEGLITVPLDAEAIANTIDSLLVDCVRSSALAHRAAAHISTMVDAREAARILLSILESPDSPAVGQHDRNRGKTTPSLLSIVS